MTAEPAFDYDDDVTPEFDIGDGEPAAWCPYCDRPFASRRLWALHLGDRHSDECTDAERTAVEEATDDELDDLFVFHIKVVAALTLLYAVVVLVYMIVLGWG
jgi:hypothetical protein